MGILIYICDVARCWFFCDAQVLDEPNWPDTWPYRPEDFGRYDESSDTLFYDAPRFVTHIDDAAISALTKHYEETFPPSSSKDVAILDMCSSWIRCGTYLCIYGGNAS
jgi:hypothetical protein